MKGLIHTVVSFQDPPPSRLFRLHQHFPRIVFLRLCIHVFVRVFQLKQTNKQTKYRSEIDTMFKVKRFQSHTVICIAQVIIRSYIKSTFPEGYKKNNIERLLSFSEM